MLPLRRLYVFLSSCASRWLNKFTRVLVSWGQSRTGSGIRRKVSLGDS
jgi:hypothetical protein